MSCQRSTEQQLTRPLHKDQEPYERPRIPLLRTKDESGSQFTFARAKRRSVTEWYLPIMTEEPFHYLAPRTAPIDQRGFLEMWHGKKYGVVWVTFDGKVLSVYESKEEHFSRLFVPVSSIVVLVEKDDSRFLVSTRSQELIFRGNPAEHKRWTCVLRAAMNSQQAPGLPFLAESAIKKSGNLALKEMRSKVFVVLTNDWTWVFNTETDFTDGFGVLCIEMNIARVRKGGRGALEVITPYRTFCFSAGSEKEAEDWVAAMSRVADDSLCNDEVAEQIWSLPENQRCADCGSLQPEWVSVNLVAVICTSCAGQHRSLGTSISNIKSLRMDSTIWTEPLIQIFIQVGNRGSSNIWALNVPPSESITPSSSPEDRHRFIYAKYREGKYRKFHRLFGDQEALDEALRQAVLSDDNIDETMLLVFSGAQVTCGSNLPGQPTPIDLAEKAGNLLQLEFLKQNEHKEKPSPDPVVPYPVSPTESSCKRVPWKRMSQDQLPVQIQGSKLCFYENQSQEPTHSIEIQTIISVTRCPSGKWVDIWTSTDSYRCEASTRENATLLFRLIAQILLPHKGYNTGVVEKSERMTQIRILADGSEEGEEAWALLRPKDMMILSANLKETCAFAAIQDIRFNVEACLMSIQTKERPWELVFLAMEEFSHWCSVLCDIPSPHKLIQDKKEVKMKKPSTASTAIFHCLEYLNQHGLTTNGIYRQCGKKSRVDDLLAALKKDPDKQTVKLNRYTVYEVAGAFKHLLREMDDLFTKEHSSQWMQATDVKEDGDRVKCYSTLLDFIPIHNKLLLKAVFAHLHSVHLQSGVNKMTAYNLSMVFAPTLFNNMQDLGDSSRLLHDFITHYPAIFNTR
ncbi:arf-GAP with Rho-GAP domain, ANK repeat and PH domain-containing protein 1-like isoform X2 [Ambystoma mexicanum]|uniref:arf-GAP with Rho-GAP domain, ANK repeat and PH domain-containing protein 1-like isoform X2 n=1 Tax=Ambystoma mexicanum TaxID=8296 RepID=UPI0037E71C8E